MATLFTRREAKAAGITDSRLEWAVEQGRYARVAYGVYFKGDRPPAPFEIELAQAMINGRRVGGPLAAALHGFDGFDSPADGNYKNVPKLPAHDTLLSLAARVDDRRWEQALEWCLRKGKTTIERIEKALGAQRHGNRRIRRVLKLRPKDAPATGSLLETHMVQLIRRDPFLPTPSRQVNVRHWYVDLAWPDHGVFLELDGEWHKDQPHYDAVRQTGVIAATKWLVGRFNWTQVVHQPNTTLRSLCDLLGSFSNRASA
jgi:very-short-patch-repair endonuclease